VGGTVVVGATVVVGGTAGGTVVVGVTGKTIGAGAGLVGAGLVMVQVKVTDPLAPRLSVAVTVTDGASAVVGVPEMMPVAGPMDNPSGRPRADQV
jgi:hypothetical protein